METQVQQTSKPAPKIRKAKNKAEKQAESQAKAKKEPKPKDMFGFRENSKESIAAAMYYSGEGATTDQVREKLGGPHLNLLKKVKELGFEVTEIHVASPTTNRSVKKYRIVKGTPKGA